MSPLTILSSLAIVLRPVLAPIKDIGLWDFHSSLLGTTEEGSEDEDNEQDSSFLEGTPTCNSKLPVGSRRPGKENALPHRYLHPLLSHREHPRDPLSRPPDLGQSMSHGASSSSIAESRRLAPPPPFPLPIMKCCVSAWSTPSSLPPPRALCFFPWSMAATVSERLRIGPLLKDGAS